MLVFRVFVASRQNQRVFDARLDAVQPEGLSQVGQKVTSSDWSRNADLLSNVQPKSQKIAPYPS